MGIRPETSHREDPHREFLQPKSVAAARFSVTDVRNMESSAQGFAVSELRRPQTSEAQLAAAGWTGPHFTVLRRKKPMFSIQRSSKGHSHSLIPWQRTVRGLDLNPAIESMEEGAGAFLPFLLTFGGFSGSSWSHGFKMVWPSKTISGSHLLTLSIRNCRTLSRESHGWFWTHSSEPFICHFYSDPMWFSSLAGGRWRTSIVVCCSVITLLNCSCRGANSNAQIH